MLAFALLLACDEAEPGFQPYDPDAVEVADDLDMAPEVDPTEAERRLGSFGPRTQAVFITAPAGVQTDLVGFTPRTMGRWVFPGSRVGLNSGVAACSAMSAGTRPCTVDQLLAAESAGVLAGLPDTELWVADTLVNPSGGANDNCAGYTYEGADARWRGLAVAWAVNPASGTQELQVDKVSGGTMDAACLRDLAACAGSVPSITTCNTARPIACCK